jgi:peptidylprolyl isomerase
MTRVENGNTVSVHYAGTLNSGTEFDSSYKRGEPISFVVGSGQMIAGFDAALPGMAVGETKDITITPNDAYGERNEKNVEIVPVTQFPKDLDLTKGQVIRGMRNGQQFMAKIMANDTHTVTLDLNHPLAGEDLNFKIELMSISSETSDTVALTNPVPEGEE